MGYWGDFEDLLQDFKDAPKRESAAVLLDDGPLLKYAVIWLRCPPERRLVDGMAVRPADDSWTALWDCVVVPYESIAMMADDELVKARKMVERLKGLRLVYPDGSVQDLVTKIITKRIHKALE